MLQKKKELISECGAGNGVLVPLFKSRWLCPSNHSAHIRGLGWVTTRWRHEAEEAHSVVPAPRKCALLCNRHDFQGKAVRFTPQEGAYRGRGTSGASRGAAAGAAGFTDRSLKFAVILNSGTASMCAPFPQLGFCSTDSHTGISRPSRSCTCVRVCMCVKVLSEHLSSPS